MSEPTDPKTKHWRRHDEAYLPAGDYTADTARKAFQTATACGRLRPFDQTVGDPSEADCSECEEVWRGLGYVKFLGDRGVVVPSKARQALLDEVAPFDRQEYDRLNALMEAILKRQGRP